MRDFQFPIHFLTYASLTRIFPHEFHEFRRDYGLAAVTTGLAAVTTASPPFYLKINKNITSKCEIFNFLFTF